MKRVRFGIKGFIDRRTPELLAAARALEQAKIDEAVEQRWRDLVRANEARREALSGIPLYLRLAS